MMNVLMYTLFAVDYFTARRIMLRSALLRVI